MIQKFKEGAYSENASKPQLYIVIVGAVTEQAWCADLKVMFQAVLGRAHAYSIGPRYVKCLRPKKEGRELVECLSD